MCNRRGKSSPRLPRQLFQSHCLNHEHILRLKEEHAQNKFRAEDLEQKLMQARKQLTARDLRVQELEEQHAVLQERVQDLENQLQRVREEDEAAHNLFRCEHELDQTRQEKERLVIDLEKAKKVRGGWV